MPPRAYWKGFLKLSLVSCPVALYPAIAAAERISFRQINRETGNRLRQQLVDTVTGEVVQPTEKARGYQIAENRFAVVGDEELAAAREEARTRPYSTPPAQPDRPAPPPVPAPTPVRSAPLARPRIIPEETRTEVVPIRPPAELPEPAPAPAPPPVNDRTITLDRFVRRADVDERYFDTPYYLAPREEMGQEAFAVIRDAIRHKKMAGMGRVILARRERPIIVEAFEDGLLAFTLRYAHEVREPAEIFAEIPKLTLPEDMREVAERIIEMKAGEVDPAFLEDRYRTALLARLREKHPEAPPRGRPAEPPRQNVIDLMAALKRSLSTEAAASRETGRRQAAAAKAKSAPAKRARPDARRKR